MLDCGGPIIGNRKNWRTMFISLLPSSQLWFVLMVRYYCFDLHFVEERNRTKVTRHTNDVYELFIHVDTSNA